VWDRVSGNRGKISILLKIPTLGSSLALGKFFYLFFWKLNFILFIVTFYLVPKDYSIFTGSGSSGILKENRVVLPKINKKRYIPFFKKIVI